MRKKIVTLALSAALAVSMCVPVFAGQWYQDRYSQWYYKEVADEWLENSKGQTELKRGSEYVSNCWMWIDGKCYYFGADMCMWEDGITPDGYTVDASGALVDVGVDPTSTITPVMKNEKYYFVNIHDNVKRNETVSDVSEAADQGWAEYYTVEELTATEARVYGYAFLDDAWVYDEYIFTKDSNGIYRWNIDGSDTFYWTITFNSENQISIRKHSYYKYGNLTVDLTSIYKTQ